ncbi:DUF4265 domain-containing protein [Streptomyces clavuligerus]|nr:DUF4265 domain-containing protein [Streptomyces clavuligerus]ANW22327.1 hypothetical protein BB341_28775 [Streptomyces clavuligerus]AXU17224.1 DUF4265 domain-containing protein [Streptomyces clavuligerus]EDY47442.1 conserved hypothetical protein [Streptomyces clavuligerus]MBY6307130.1 DUF4265 domain-containing protein [Streptomyces clavuligerus]QCS10292.1 DUF4265 domain-containing protein [Streptomyces clavuligerus]
MMAFMEGAVEQIKVWFRFVPREGWLPQDTEGLWAVRLSDGTARVENAAFLQDGVAEGDVVRYRTDSDGHHWAVGRTSSSGNCTIRVVPVPTGPLGSSAQPVRQRLSVFGLRGEVFSEDFPMVAFTVPAGADFAGIKALLAEGRAQGWWHYEVGCGTDEWWAA